MAFRTQKISQMTPKGSNLESTDLIEVSTIESGSYVTRSITGQELIDAIPAPSVEWGDIGGTLSAQTDLQTALNAKQNTLVSGTSIKTINSTSLLGSGDVAVQPTLVSGTNIKTIEGQSLLGSGNIDLTKSDVGLGNVDNTSDANKPISTATQTALNAKQNTIYNAKAFGTFANTTGETQLVQITIPANTFSSVDKLSFFAMFSKTGTSNAWTIRIKISTSSSMPLGVNSQIAQAQPTATQLFTKINRDFMISGGTLKGFPFTANGNTDAASGTGAIGSVAFDPTVTQYFYISVTPAGSGDTITLEGFEIKEL